LHKPPVRSLQGKRHWRQAVCDKVDPEDLNRNDRQNLPGKHSDKHDKYETYVTCKTVCNEVFNILQDIPTLFDCRHDGCEIVIGQDHARSFFTNIRTCNTHSYSHICGFQSRSVIYSVSRHCNYVSLFLEGLNHFQLVFW